MSLITKRRWIVSSKCINYLYNDIGCVLLNNCKCKMDYQAVKKCVQCSNLDSQSVHLIP